METGQEESSKDINEKGSEMTGKNAPKIEYEDLLKKISELTKTVETLKASKGESANQDTIASVVEGAIRASNSSKDFSQGIQEEQIPLDDYNETGVRFCYPSSGYIVADDRRKGQIVKLPYNKEFIYFSHIMTRIIQQGKYGQTAPVCAYVSHSNKEIKWLREHTLYGTLIFETTTAAMNKTAEVAMKIANVMSVVQEYSFVDLLKRCTEYNIEKTDNADVMRANLAFAMADRATQNERAVTQRMLEDNYKGREILEKR